MTEDGQYLRLERGMQDENSYPLSAQSLPVPLYVVLEGRIVFANAAGVCILRALSVDQLLGEPFSRFFQDLPAWLEPPSKQDADPTQPRAGWCSAPLRRACRARQRRAGTPSRECCPSASRRAVGVRDRGGRRGCWLDGRTARRTPARTSGRRRRGAPGVRPRPAPAARRGWCSLRLARAPAARPGSAPARSCRRG